MYHTLELVALNIETITSDDCDTNLDDVDNDDIHVEVDNNDDDDNDNDNKYLNFQECFIVLKWR